MKSHAIGSIGREQHMTFDDYCAAVREASVNYVLTGRQEAPWGLEFISEFSIAVQFGRDGASVVDGIARPDAFVLMWRDVHSAANIRMNGHIVDTYDIVLLAPGSHFIFSADGPRTWISVSLPIEALPAGWPTGQRAAAESALRQSILIRGTAGRTLALVSGAENLRAAVVGCAPQEVRTAAEATLFDACLDAIADSQRLQLLGDSDGCAYDIVCRALKTFHTEELGDRWSVGDLARATDAGPRTMLRAFKAIIGMGPVRYLRYRQLNLVRRELRATAHDNSYVTRSMKAVGISEFGRAAGNYRSLFGELPSETLRATGRASLGSSADTR